MGVKEGIPGRFFSEKEALGVVEKEFSLMGSTDQARFLARLRGSVKQSFVLVATGKNGTGRLIETEKVIPQLSNKSTSQNSLGAP